MTVEPTIALFQAGQAAQQKGDAAGAINYGNRAIEADPKNYQALLLVSGALSALMESRYQKETRLETPQLTVSYKAPAKSWYAPGIGS